MLKVGASIAIKDVGNNAGTGNGMTVTLDDNKLVTIVVSDPNNSAICTITAADLENAAKVITAARKAMT